MVTKERNSRASIAESLVTEPYTFEFHQVIKLLEMISVNATPLGEGSDPLREPVFIKSEISLSPPSSQVKSLELVEGQHQPILHLNMFGLAGLQGPLPMPFTEILLKRIREDDTAMRDFLDIFNHRLASFWHRIAKKIRVDLANIPAEDTPIGGTFLDLMGLGSPYLRKSLSIPATGLLRFTSLLWQRPRSAEGLESLIGTYFDVRAKVTSFIGGYHQALDQDVTKIGRSGQFNALGQGAILGNKIWDQMRGIGLQIGPLKWKDYLAFIPLEQNGIGIDYTPLKEWLFMYAGPEYNIKIELEVNKEEIPCVRLNQSAALGLTTWLITQQGGLDSNPKVEFSLSPDSIFQST